MAKMIRMFGDQFEVLQPYAEGYGPLTAVEAQSLNQTRAENIGNNLRAALKDAKDNGKLDEFRESFARYDAEYTFATPRTGSTRVVRDPVEKEARSIAREQLAKKIGAETPPRKLKDVDPEKLEAAIELVSNREDVQKLAKKRVAEKARVSEAILAEIDV